MTVAGEPAFVVETSVSLLMAHISRCGQLTFALVDVFLAELAGPPGRADTHREVVHNRALPPVLTRHLHARYLTVFAGETFHALAPVYTCRNM